VSVETKICGLNSEATVKAAVAGGARYVGFNFYAPSPRAVTPERAGELARDVPRGVRKVAVVVDADDGLLEAIVGHLDPDLIQLHGKETPERAVEIARRFGCRVMKAISVSSPGDVERARVYEAVVDLFLFDAKPPTGGLPGGNGLPFDWQLLAGQRWSKPWFLSGGLDAVNLAEAVRLTGAERIDVSSGVEERPGVKSPEKIRAFLAAARLAQSPCAGGGRAA
jgi:phosphoribosylanthranilate isomerase